MLTTAPATKPAPRFEVAPAVGDTVRIAAGGYAGTTAKVERIASIDGQARLVLYTASGITLWFYKPAQVELL